jgi:glycosyltransferase involved in cell wall biosynthesis
MLVAFSHLRWDSVWQRPQHLLTRFAREMPVLVVEEPKAGLTPALGIRRERGVTIATPLLPLSCGAEGFDPVANEMIGRLIAPLVDRDDELILWYYTPMALGAEPPQRQPALTVYDAMDDLASFRSAPRAMRMQEARLLTRVDLVFAGGRTLYERRKDQHPAVYCFPSGVESAHFAAALNGIPRPAALERRSRPILGYIGVLDERIDLDLLGRVADLRPHWTIALVGPTAKIKGSTIPRRANIVRFGYQPYDALPDFLAAFDVAMLPFARNDATRSISPTKTLEYLAGGRPVVSTPIRDVVDLYGSVVSIAATPEAFVQTTESLLAWSGEEVHDWRLRVEALVAAHGWDGIAASMLALMHLRLMGDG